MKMSTKGKYALEIVTDLAMHSSEEHLESLKNIAGRRQLSEKYLERIIKMLKNEKIVKSVRGAYGGYCLAKSPEAISVAEVLTAVEGALAPVACLTDRADCKVDCDGCPTRGTWQEMWERILETVGNVTIADIVEGAKDSD